MRPPLRFVCETPRTMRRIVLKFCIAYGASFAQLLVKKFDRVKSGHGAMTSQEVQGQAIFFLFVLFWNLAALFGRAPQCLTWRDWTGSSISF